jgi:putative endopeptidase
VATLHKAGVPVLFRARDTQDSKDATKVILDTIQGGLGMPDRDYYLKDDEHMTAVRAEYLAHVERMFVLVGRKPAAAKKAAADVLALETELAKNHRPRTELRDAEKSYNRVDRAGLESSLPSMAWTSYFATLGFPDIQEVTTTSPAYLTALDGIMKGHKAAEWQEYLELHVARGFAPALAKRFADEAFAWQKVISGQKEQRVRWKRCVESTDRLLGELVGQPYVKANFGGESKDAALLLVKEITRAFRENLAVIAWMDDDTKVKAVEKSKQLEYLIGYPDSWRKYDFVVDPKDYGKNVVAGSAFDMKWHLSQISKPVDKKLWHMSPPTVNAYYDPGLNEMVFPAGILQPPFYTVKAAIPVNLGGMGMVVGHELTHGYDDQGAKFDGAGNMSGWWPTAVNEKFHARTQCVVDYYSSYEAAPGLNENGELTQGENIADMGGVKLAFRAYQNLRKDASKRAVADGFNEDKQFFLSVGQAWCAKGAPEFERLQIATNPHALPRFRVNGSLSSMPAFAATWSCPVDSKMNPKNRCEVW